MTTLTLGDFEFARYEIPQSISFGAEQKLNVHQLVGGTRVIDVLGPIPRNPAWTGWFVGQNALARARYLKGLCEAGNPQALTWGEMAYTVVIRSVECDYRLAWRIPYSIACEVVSDDTAPITAAPSPSPEQLVGDDMASATALAARLGNPALTSAVAKVSAALASIKTFVGKAQSEIRTALQPIADARAVVGELLNEASSTLAVTGQLASINGLLPNPVSDFVNRIALSSEAAATSGILADLDSRLARMDANILAVGTGTKTITTGSGTLFGIAANEFGDARAWTAIAQANNLTDPQIAGIVTLVVPPKPASADSTGILNA